MKCSATVTAQHTSYNVTINLNGLILVLMSTVTHWKRFTWAHFIIGKSEISLFQRVSIPLMYIYCTSLLV